MRGKKRKKEKTQRSRIVRLEWEKKIRKDDITTDRHRK